MKQCILALLLTIGCCVSAAAQPADTGGWDTSRELDSPRSMSLFLHLGYAQIIGAGMLVQVTDRHALGIITSDFWLATPPAKTLFPTVRTFGLRGTYAFHPDGQNNFLFANAFIVDVLYLFPKESDYWHLVADPGGIGIEAFVGRDAPLGQGVGILWGIGASAYFIGGGRPDYTPAFRLGLHLDI